MSRTDAPTRTGRRAVRSLPVRPRPALVLDHADPGQRLRVAGRIDVHTVADVRTAVREAIDHGHGELLLDAAEAEIGDTTALGVLLGAHRRALRAGRTLVLLDVPAPMARLLTATRLHRVLRTRVERPDCAPVSA